MRDRDALARVWIYVADSSCRGYSPLYDHICRAVAESDAVLDMVGDSPPESHNPVLLLAAVHHLLLGGLDHPLAAVYRGESDADPGPLFVDLCLRERNALQTLLATRHVNTNEVGRAAVLGPAFTTIAARLGEPLAHIDVGCSAGLNLLCDRYLLDYGPAGATGPSDAAVRIECRVAGGTPPIAPLLPPIVARVGLDRFPVDVTDDTEARWQLACVWPDTGRLPRTRLAIEEARRAPLMLQRGDAVESVGPAVAGLPSDAIAVVTTTLVVAYLSPTQRAGFREALAAASHDRPRRMDQRRGPGRGRCGPERHGAVRRPGRRGERARAGRVPQRHPRRHAARVRPPPRQLARLADVSSANHPSRAGHRRVSALRKGCPRVM